MSVRTVSTRVLVDGVETDHEHVTWHSRSSGALPPHLGGQGARWDSTAEVTWWTPGVGKTLPSPWTGDRVPADGSKVEIFAQSTGPERLVFTGVVTSSSADGPTVTSRCIDTRDRLRRTIRTEPVSTFTPPHEDGWSFNTRTGCTPLWPVYQIARAGGLNATYVPPGQTTHIDVPMVGAIWAMPNGGRVVQSARWSDDSNPNYGPQHVPAEWGLGVGDGTVQVQPTGTQTTRRYRVGLTVASTSAAPIDLQIIHAGSTPFWAVHVTAARVVQMRTVDSGGAVTVVASLALYGSLAVAVTIRGTSVTIETDDGRTATGTGTIPAGIIERVHLRAETGASVGGLAIVDPGASGGSFVTFYDGPSLVVQYGLGAQVVDVVPSIRDEDGLTVLQDIAQQCLGAVRMDPQGRLLYRTMESLWAQAPTHYVSVAREVLAAAWETDAQAAASRIAVRHRVWGVSRSTKETVTVATIGGSLDPGEQREEWITTPDDEEWWYPDYSTELAGVAGGVGSSGSWRGASIEDTNGDTVPYGSFSLFLDHITPWTTRVRISTPQAMRLQMATTVSVPWHLRGGDGLVFRARGKAIAREDIKYAGVGPSWAQEYEHDGSRWVADSVAQACADWLAGLGLTIGARLTNLGLLFDETIEPWSTVQADLADMLGVTVTLLVEEASQRPADGVTHVTGVVKDVTVTSATYAGLARAWASGSYSGLSTAWAGDDYDDLAAQPLKGAPA